MMNMVDVLNMRKLNMVMMLIMGPLWSAWVRVFNMGAHVELPT
jgi:hypothetical protein